VGVQNAALADVAVMITSNAFWRDRPTLVTGATGLLGSALVPQLLAVGADIVCLIRDTVPQSNLVRAGWTNRVKTVHGDIADQALLERALGEYEIATVFHLAAQTIVGVANANPISTFESNIAGTWRLMEACRRSPRVKQIAVASSDKAYGDQTALPYDETMPVNGRFPYDVSKSCTDLIAQSYSHTYDLPVLVTRCGNFFGPGDLNWNRLVPGTIRSLVRGQRPVIRSDGKYIRDYIFIEDAAKAYIQAVEQLAQKPEIRGHAFNFSTETQLTVVQMVELVARLMKSDAKPEIRNEATAEIPHQYLSAAKAREMLGWKPAFTIEEGLARTIPWYVDFLTENPVW
jgi:CDP-glucose 4,6-dehydratase